jgi:hypothetical protein
LREIKPRKFIRDDENLVPQNIFFGQGCPPAATNGRINEATP